MPQPLKVVTDAYNSTLNKLPLGSTNNPDIPVRPGTSNTLRMTRLDQRLDQRGLPGVDWTDRYSVEKWVERDGVYGQMFGAGNCGEMVALTYRYLKTHLATPLDVMYMPDLGAHYNHDNHIFIVVYGDSLPTLGHFTPPNTWGPRAIICDPWIRYCGPAAAVGAPAVFTTQASYSAFRLELTGPGRVGRSFEV